MLIQSGKSTIDTHTIVDLEEFEQFKYIYPVVGGMCWNLLKKYLMNVD